MRSRLFISGVIAQVRSSVPGVTRRKLEPVMLRYFPGDDDAVRWEMDIAFGVPEGMEG